jgi:glycosyltransferase involved in cell wall biosynthesis
MNPATLALCIPAYRSEEHLPRLILTAQQQQPLFDEIIVCVDASPDRTAEVAKKWGVTVLVNEKNLGCSNSKNRALETATADWVHFHDADDILLPGFTKEAHHWMRMQNAPEVVIMGFEHRDFKTNELFGVGLVDDTELAKDSIGFSIRRKLPNFGIYQRKALLKIGGFDCDPAVLYNEDVAFHTKLALAGFRFRASSVVTSVNWRHENSMHQRNPVACLMAHHAVMLKVAPRANTKHFETIAQNLWLVAQGLAIHGEWQKVDTVLSDALRIYPAVPAGQSRDFALVCRLIGLHRAFRLREKLIRWFKPNLRLRSRFLGKNSVSRCSN